MSILKQRILTAIILIPLVFASILYTPPLVFSLILGAILLLAAWEWSSLAKLESKNQRMGYLVLLALFFYLSTFIPISMVLTVSIIWWLFASYRMVRHQLNQPWTIKNPIFIASIGIFVLTSCFASLSWLRYQSKTWVILLLLIIWLADTAAYFAGRRFGQHLLAPTISPKKTWEGVFGALFAVFLAIVLDSWFMDLNPKLSFYLLLIGLITVIISIVGDLFESLLKRQADTKDSGQLLPGHGGLLDRIDSLIAAAPFFAAGVCLL